MTAQSPTVPDFTAPERALPGPDDGPLPARPAAAADFSRLITRAMDRSPAHQDKEVKSSFHQTHSRTFNPRLKGSAHRHDSGDPVTQRVESEDKTQSDDSTDAGGEADPSLVGSVATLLPQPRPSGMEPTQPPQPQTGGMQLKEQGADAAGQTTDGAETISATQTATITQGTVNSALSTILSVGAGGDALSSATGIQEKTESQPVDPQELTNLKAIADPADSSTGTSSALNTQRMKSAAEQNDFAGLTVQKLPHPSKSGDVSVDSTGTMGAKSSLENSESHKETAPTVPVADLMARFSSPVAQQGNAPEGVATPNNSSSQLERLTHLVNREVITIKQSGASTLAVSLKVDSQTELFLQLTNHDGQLQAAIRCERGTIAGLDRHWGQLQESLARQNVQLLPLEEKAPARGHPFNSSSDNSTQQRFDEASQNRREPARDARGERPVPATPAKSATPRATKTRHPANPGWESWA